MHPSLSPKGSSNVAVVGGAVGGAIIVALLTGVAIALMCVMMVKRRHKQKQKIQEYDGMALENVTYDGGE